MSCVMGGAVLIVVLVIFMISSCLRSTGTRLERRLRGKSQPGQLNGGDPKLPLHHRDKYIVFRQLRRGQGAGNAIAGLLAAHLLGEEFNRLVCVSTEDNDWLQVFRPKIPQAIEECPNLPSQSKSMTLDLLLLNYGVNVNECRVRDILASSEPIIWLSGNTYPRWSKVPKAFFTKFYEPTSKLKAILPWKEPPHTVVHLRHGDSNGDLRDGLDIDTLRKLGETLPEDTFLVTNWLTWYSFFNSKYGWRHPPWQSVRHSGLPAIRWEDLDKKAEISDEDHYLQLWSDWYSIAMAGNVYHTHSDFSISAIHWMDVESRTIRGVNEDGTLDLAAESWRSDPEMPPLSLRSPEELLGCKAEHHPANLGMPVSKVLEERRRRGVEQGGTDNFQRPRQREEEESSEDSNDYKRDRGYREEKRGFYRSEE